MRNYSSGEAAEIGFDKENLVTLYFLIKDLLKLDGEFTISKVYRNPTIIGQIDIVIEIFHNRAMFKHYIQSKSKLDTTESNWTVRNEAIISTWINFAKLTAFNENSDTSDNFNYDLILYLEKGNGKISSELMNIKKNLEDQKKREKAKSKLLSIMLDYYHNNDGNNKTAVKIQTELNSLINDYEDFSNVSEILNLMFDKVKIIIDDNFNDFDDFILMALDDKLHKKALLQLKNEKKLDEKTINEIETKIKIKLQKIPFKDQLIRKLGSSNYFSNNFTELLNEIHILHKLTFNQTINERNDKFNIKIIYSIDSKRNLIYLHYETILREDLIEIIMNFLKFGKNVKFIIFYDKIIEKTKNKANAIKNLYILDINIDSNLKELLLQKGLVI